MKRETLQRAFVEAGYFRLTGKDIPGHGEDGDRELLRVLESASNRLTGKELHALQRAFDEVPK